MPSVNDLLASYDKLNPFEQSVLQVLSIIYEPAHTTLIVSCLRKLELKGPRGNRPTTASINHYISKMQSGGLLSDTRQCHLDIVEIISRKAVAEGTFNHFATVIRKEAPVTYYYGKWTTRCWRAMREMRIGIYCQDFEIIDQAIDFLDSQCRDILTPAPPAVQVVTGPFDREWFRELPPSFQFFLLNHILNHAQRQLVSFPEVLSYLEDEAEFNHLSEDERLPFRRLLLNHYLLQGNLRAADTILEHHKELFLATGARGTAAFLKGDFGGAQQLFQEDRQNLMKISGTDSVAFFGIHGLFYILSEIRQSERADLHRVSGQITIALSLFENSDETEAYKQLAALVDSLSNQRDSSERILLPEEPGLHSLTLLFAGLTQFWLNASLEQDLEREVHNFYNRARAHDYHFFSITLADLLSHVLAEPEEYQQTAAELSAATGVKPFLDTIESEETWKRSLQALINISTTTIQEQVDRDVRLVWLVEYRSDNFSARPREQRRAENGQWSKGRPVSLARLHASAKLPYLTLQDRKICLAIRKEETGDAQPHYDFDREKLLLALVGHPLLFLGNSPTTPVEFVLGEPELLVQEQGENLHIQFSIPITSDNTALFKETPTRYKVIRINDNHRRISQITGRNGLTVPVQASEQVLTAIGNISSFMTVHSAIADDASARQSRDITLVDADSTIYMHMLPYGSGFRLEMFVKPFAEGSHYLKPGQGVENIMAEVGGRRLQMRRHAVEAKLTGSC